MHIKYSNITTTNEAAIHLKSFHSYCVQVAIDSMGTIQFETSNPDVIIRLSVLDQEKEVAARTGRGFVVLPVFHFLAKKG